MSTISSKAASRVIRRCSWKASTSRRSTRRCRPGWAYGIRPSSSILTSVGRDTPRMSAASWVVSRWLCGAMVTAWPRAMASTTSWSTWYTAVGSCIRAPSGPTSSAGPSRVIRWTSSTRSSRDSSGGKMVRSVTAVAMAHSLRQARVYRNSKETKAYRRRRACWREVLKALPGAGPVPGCDAAHRVRNNRTRITTSGGIRRAIVAQQPATKYVYDFAEGNKDLKDLLGGKGANLAEMTNLGLPVPPGFIITTEACRQYLTEGTVPESLDAEVSEHLAQLEKAMGRKLGDPADPLLVSVRSGAKFSMPGMMETVLNIGLSDESVHGLAKQAGNDRLAWDSYRRLIQMFGKTVLGIDGEDFEHVIDAAKQAKGTKNDLDLEAGDLRRIVDSFKEIVREHTGHDFPQEPREQLDMAIRAVFDSWNADRAILYRRQERIPADLGTAVNVVAMVFGNVGMDSGTGVAFTRDPGSGQQGVYGDYLQNAQGEDVVAGIRNTVPLQDLEQIDPKSYGELMQIMQTLENHYRDLCDIEFTIERGKLWMP